MHTTPWLIILIPLFPIAISVGAGSLAAVLGGWKKLAHYYEATEPFDGQRFYVRSGQFAGYVNYNGCLNFGTNLTGLYISVFVLLRIGHPPLLVPWADITARDSRRWFFETTDITFAKTPGVLLRVRRKLANELLGASGRLSARTTDNLRA
jgi:hypothetical protein